MRYKIIARLLGLLTISVGINMLGALLWALYYSESVWKELLISMVISVAIGYLLIRVGKKSKYTSLTHKEALFTVGAGWFTAGLVGALPFFISGEIPQFYNAFFETISGFTTTGASILTDIESLPKGLLFWRSYTHWLGGMGIIVLFVAIFPFLGVSGKKMYQFEVPGPNVGGLAPKIQSSAFILWAIYIGLSSVEIIFLWISGMTLFDAMCHTFGTMATGGFSTKNGSIGHYDSQVIYLIITFFMILAGANFSLYYFILKRKIAQVSKDTEFRTYILIILISTIVFTIALYKPQSSKIATTSDLPYQENISESAIVSAFNVVSIMTTTGYGNVDTNRWQMMLKIWLFLLMFVGGCGGSTGGGIKVVRFVILIKYAAKHLITSYSPQRKVIVKLAGRPVDNTIIHRTLSFFFLYLLIYGIGILVISSFGYDWAVTLSSVAATLNNIGPGFSLVGSTGNYAFMHPFAKIFLSVLMVAGRLELFAVIMYFVPDFWKN